VGTQAGPSSCSSRSVGSLPQRIEVNPSRTAVTSVCTALKEQTALPPSSTFAAQERGLMHFVQSAMSDALTRRSARSRLRRAMHRHFVTG
jgi:hypothetical protein